MSVVVWISVVYSTNDQENDFYVVYLLVIPRCVSSYADGNRDGEIVNDDDASNDVVNGRLHERIAPQHSCFYLESVVDLKMMLKDAVEASYRPCPACRGFSLAPYQRPWNTSSSVAARPSSPWTTNADDALSPDPRYPGRMLWGSWRLGASVVWKTYVLRYITMGW